MPVAVDIQAFLQQLQDDNIPDIADQTVAEARARSEYFLQLAPTPDSSGIAITNHDVTSQQATFQVRQYCPQDKQHRASIIWFHGGGFVLGSLKQSEALCLQLAKRLNVQIFSVDYRLAPEYPFPAATEDAYAATLWLLQQAESLSINPQQIYTAGTSAGANLATVVTLKMRDQQQRAIAGQLLLYPVTDNNPGRDSYQKYGKDHYLTIDGMAWFLEKYMDDAQTVMHSPYAFPLKADSLKDLPPAFIVTAEYDLLIDEGKDYAQRLQQEGVAVEYRCAEGMIHGFSEFSGVIPSASETLASLLNEIDEWMTSLK